MRLLFAFGSLGFALSSCSPVEEDAPPVVGVFTVESTLVANGCGQGGLMIPAVTELEATVRGYPGNVAQFRWSGQATSANGIATTNGSYSFETSSTSVAIQAEPSIGYVGCQLTERTAMTFTLSPIPVEPGDAGVDGADAGVVDYTLDGRITIDIVPVSGSDCSPLLGVNGGSWLAMPCQATIDLAGSRDP